MPACGPIKPAPVVDQALHLVCATDRAMPGNEALRSQFEQALERGDPPLHWPSPHDWGNADEQDVGGECDPCVRDPDDQVTWGVSRPDLDQPNLAPADVEIEPAREGPGGRHEPNLVEREGRESFARVGG